MTNLLEQELSFEYKEFLVDREYNLEDANVHILKNSDVSVKDFVEVFSEKEIGCCLHHATAWLKKLKNMGIESHLAGSLEEDGNTHACVYFILDGTEYISDVVKDVKNETFSHLAIDVEEFKKRQINNQLWLYDLSVKNYELKFFQNQYSLMIKL